MPTSEKKQIHRNWFKWIQIVAKDMLLAEGKKRYECKNIQIVFFSVKKTFNASTKQ